ncbi:DUF3488 and transglutaminase-like domain-containing protein [Pseudomonas sp. F1_0610]|uniref:transglutaminase family protein n=1 Tax=Pseudomonas sp. F1_0610 TaxID=3114284 RepID=UPI0039C11523
MNSFSAQPLPRTSITWLLVAQALVIVPLTFYLPFWATLLWLFCAGWRIQIYRSKLKYPKSLMKISLMLACAAAIFFSRGTLIGVDAGVALLISAFTLKLIEVRTNRDALVVIFLGFFCLLTHYLFDAGILPALFSLISFSALLATLIGLQQTPNSIKPMATWRMAWTLILQAVPLMLVLFLFFPRLSPLWALPAPSDQARTGLSESMTPGDVAKLSQSADLVFRVSFTGKAPEHKDLYWRALTFSHFDGQTWSAGNTYAGMAGRELKWQRRGQALDYQVIMEPNNKHWLYALDTATSSAPGITQQSDFSLQRLSPVTSLYGYKVQSWPAALRQGNLSERQQQRYLQLPATGNIESREFARNLLENAGSTDAFAEKMLAYFNQQPYYYTLTPPTLGENSVDEFMFSSRQGFCAHYAGAAVFMFRAAGIPARMVVGYQGGEFNQEKNFVQVRQLDAHAWVEYWQADVGWTTIDPTFAVAPERIELGLEAALSGQEGYLAESPFSPLNYSKYAWVNKLRGFWDNLNYQWQIKVLNFQSDEQESWFSALFGNWSWQSIALFLVSSISIIILVVMLLMFKPWVHKYTPLQRLQNNLDKFLLKKNLPRHETEGLHSYFERIEPQLTVEQKVILLEFIRNWDACLYRKSLVNIKVLRVSLAKLRRSWHK